MITSDSLGTILGIWAHPDDEAWSMVGLMKRALRNKQKVHLITATRGEAGNIDGCDDCDRSELADIRESEMISSLACIGEVDHLWLDYRDGKMSEADLDKAVNALTKIIDDLSPDTLVTFEPEGITGHSDHKTISRWVYMASKKTRKPVKVLYAIESHERYKKFGKEMDTRFNIYFDTDKPVLIREKDADLKIELSTEDVACKINCLKAHKSQMSHILADEEFMNYLEQMIASEVFMLSDNYH